MLFISEIKKFFFPFYKDTNIKKVLSLLNKSNINETKFVGGCVRNYLTNNKINDIDVATTLTPSEVIERLKNSNIEIKKTGFEHGTLTLIFKDKKFEITTLREDVSTDGRHAKVQFTKDWAKDSNRRDFTINAIYLDKNGKVYDPHLGLNDLKNNKVKFIGSPDKRIKEDFLRILRFLRFSVKYRSFEINQETEKAIKLNLDGIVSLTKERVYSELEKIINLQNLYDIFKNNFLLTIFKLIFPEFTHLDRIKKLKKMSKYFKSNIDSDLKIGLLMLDETNNYQYFFHKYNISNKTKDKLNSYSKLLKQIKSDDDFFTKNLKKNLFLIGKDKVKKIFILHTLIFNKKINMKIDKILLQIEKTKVPEFKITGNDIINHGIKNGPKIGEILKKIETRWIDNGFKITSSEIKILINSNAN